MSRKPKMFDAEEFFSHYRSDKAFYRVKNGDVVCKEGFSQEFY